MDKPLKLFLSLLIWFAAGGVSGGQNVLVTGAQKAGVTALAAPPLGSQQVHFSPLRPSGCRESRNRSLCKRGPGRARE
eukprot:210816-Prymnesium_polylepis.2